MIKKVAIVGTIISLGLVLAACKKAATPTAATTQTTESSAPVDVTKAVVINYTDAGFALGSANAKVGQAVVFKNTSSSAVSVNSDPHPTHELFPMLNLNVIAPGGSKSVTFDKAGTYKYHNHLNASQRGTIVVQ